jgi:NhaP-type Na+/H+ or K+/H+ antiporter
MILPDIQVSDVLYALFGAGALLAGILPRLLERRPLSMPMTFLGLGVLVFGLPLGLPPADPLAHPKLTEHLTEIGVIVALMGAGLKIDRPFGRRRWASTFRLLIVAMPVTIAAVALLGWWWAGLVPASALLLGAAMAPTDPVLASDVQVGEPTDEEDSEDEVRFALTSEAGLNDGLAFPFVYAAIAIAAHGLDPAGWFGTWVLGDVLYKGAVGLVGGIVIGRLLGKLFFRAKRDSLRLSRHSEGFLALAATFLAYGLVEVVGGYGFLAVFVAARAIRAAERSHEYHQVLHDFADRTVAAAARWRGGRRAADATHLAGRGDRPRPGLRDPSARRFRGTARCPWEQIGTLGDRNVRYPWCRHLLLPSVCSHTCRFPRRGTRLGDRRIRRRRVRSAARRSGNTGDASPGSLACLPGVT